MLSTSAPVELLPAPSDIDISSLKVFDCCKCFGHSWLISQTHPEQILAHKKAIQGLKDLGANVVPFDDFPEIFELLNAFRYLIRYFVFRTR